MGDGIGSMIGVGEACCPEGVVDEQGFVRLDAFSRGHFRDMGEEEGCGGGTAYALSVCKA